MTKILFKQKMALVIFGLFLGFVLLEIALRAAGFILLSLQEQKNKIATRQKGSCRIVCLGESTTFCGGEHSYPSQLEKILNQSNLGIKFSVINKGIPGTNSGIIISQLEDNLNKHNPDMVIAMMGANDGSDIIQYSTFKIEKLIKSILLRVANKIKGKRPCVAKVKKEEMSFKIENVCNADEIKVGVDTGMNKEAEEQYLTLGWYYFNQKEYGKAEKAYKKAIKINPGNDRACVQLGEYCYRSLGKYDKAEEMFKKAIGINPKNDGAYTQLGVVFSRLGKRDKAEKMFKKAIEINPKNDWAYLQLGTLYINYLREYNEAERLFKEAIKVNPKNDRLYGALANCCAIQGKHSNARQYFNKANNLRLKNYVPLTAHAYQELRKIVTQKGIMLICVQYPLRSIEPLRKMFDSTDGVIFVDNEMLFKNALKNGRYDQYFTDCFGGDFGHCTAKGNRLLAENIANGIKKCFFNK